MLGETPLQLQEKGYGGPESAGGPNPPTAVSWTCTRKELNCTPAAPRYNVQIMNASATIIGRIIIIPRSPAW